MPRLVAFLRAVNVGGRTATMDQLRTAFRALGFEDVETFIASGNVIFRSRSSGIPSLQRKIEARLRDVLGYEVTTFLRTDAQVAAIARYRPFPPAELRTAVALNVGFTAEPLGPTGRKTLLALRTEIDDFHVHGAEVYWLCRRKQSESTFSHAAFERALKARATFRGVTTITRLAAKYGFSPSLSSGRRR